MTSFLNKGEENPFIWSFFLFFRSFLNLAEYYFRNWGIRGKLVKVLLCQLANKEIAFHEKIAISRNFTFMKIQSLQYVFYSKLAVSQSTFNHCLVDSLTNWMLIDAFLDATFLEVSILIYYYNSNFARLKISIKINILQDLKLNDLLWKRKPCSKITTSTLLQRSS